MKRRFSFRTALDEGERAARGGQDAYVLEAKLNYQRDPALKGKDPAPFKAYAVPLK